MTTVTALPYSKFRIKIGDGGSPEVFTAPCGLNSRSLTETKNMNEIDLPDCQDEDKPAAVGREVRSLDWSISGEGVLSAEAYQTWEDLKNSGSSRNIMVEEEFPNSPPGTITKVGKGHLVTLTKTANRGEKVGVTIEIQGDGPLTQTVPT